MSSSDHAKQVAGLMKQLEGHYKVEPPTPQPEPMDELIYSFLLWESQSNRADAAFTRLKTRIVDFNDLRASSPVEIIEVLGKTYPRVEERAQRLRASLNELYRREHAVSLEPCAKLNKRDAKHYLETLEGIPQYVTARVLLLSFGGFAIPVEDRLCAKLRDASVVSSTDDALKAAGILERHIKATEAIPSYALLQAWAEDSWLPSGSRKSSKGKASASGSKSGSRASGASRKKKSAAET